MLLEWLKIKYPGQEPKLNPPDESSFLMVKDGKTKGDERSQYHE